MKTSSSPSFLMKRGCRSHWGHWGSWGPIRLDKYFFSYFEDGLWGAQRIHSSQFVTKLLKGQLISKCLFGILKFPQKWTKKFNFTTMEPQIELFLFAFWENWRHQRLIKWPDLYEWLAYLSNCIVKFIYSQKATKFFEIFPLLLTSVLWTAK